MLGTFVQPLNIGAVPVNDENRRHYRRRLDCQRWLENQPHGQWKSARSNDGTQRNIAASRHNNGKYYKHRNRGQGNQPQKGADP